MSPWARLLLSCFSFRLCCTNVDGFSDGAQPLAGLATLQELQEIKRKDLDDSRDQAEAQRMERLAIRRQQQRCAFRCRILSCWRGLVKKNYAYMTAHIRAYLTFVYHTESFDFCTSNASALMRTNVPGGFMNVWQILNRRRIVCIRSRT